MKAKPLIPANLEADKFLKVKSNDITRRYGVRVSNPWGNASDNTAWPGDVGMVVKVEGNGWDGIRLDFTRGRSLSLGTFYNDDDMPCREADATLIKWETDTLGILMPVKAAKSI